MSQRMTWPLKPMKVNKTKQNNSYLGSALNHCIILDSRIQENCVVFKQLVCGNLLQHQ